MPKIPYSQRRAQRAAETHWRRGSLVESETDLESLLSNTTYQSHATDTIAPPYYRPQGHLDYLLDSSKGSFSSNSSLQRSRSFSRAPSSFSAANNSDVDPYFPRIFAKERNIATPSLLAQNSPVSRASDDLAKEERRKRRRKANEELSTLFGSNYDSPLRSWIRWIGKIGWGSLSLWITLVVVQLVKQIYFYFLCDTRKEWAKVIKSSMISDLIWWTAVCWWTIQEGQRGGKSFRSQTVGIITTVLSPAFFPSPQSQSNSLMLYGLIFLSHGMNLLAVITICLMTLLNCDLYPYAVVMGVYLIGEAVWRGQPRWIAVYIVLGITSTLVTNIGICLIGDHADIHLGSILELIAKHQRKPFSNIFIGAFDSLPSRIWGEDMVKIDLYRTFLWLRSITRNNWTHIIVSTAASLPPLSILLYSNYSLHQLSSQPTGRNPTYSLLLLVLYITSIPVFLFSHHQAKAAIPLLPMTLMMSLRGNVARSSEGMGTNDKIWHTGLLLNVINSNNFIPQPSSIYTTALNTMTTSLWAVTIGKPIAILPCLARLGVYLVMGNEKAVRGCMGSGRIKREKAAEQDQVEK
nr:hypothetical protein L203_00358 [Cryptococcus depauperatus CBS 7841]